MTNMELICKIHKQLIHNCKYIKINKCNMKKKINRKPELTFFQIRRTDGHRNMRKRFNITNYQRSENQNHN